MEQLEKRVRARQWLTVPPMWRDCSAISFIKLKSLWYLGSCFWGIPWTNTSPSNNSSIPWWAWLLCKQRSESVGGSCPPEHLELHSHQSWLTSTGACSLLTHKGHHIMYKCSCNLQCFVTFFANIFFIYLPLWFLLLSDILLPSKERVSTLFDTGGHFLELETFIIIIIIAFKGDIPDFLQSPHSAANCLQHVHSSGLSAIVCKSRATHLALITCKCHVTCHLVRRDSSAIQFDRVEIAFIWALFYWLNH